MWIGLCGMWIYVTPLGFRRLRERVPGLNVPGAKNAHFIDVFWFTRISYVILVREKSRKAPIISTFFDQVYSTGKKMTVGHFFLNRK